MGLPIRIRGNENMHGTMKVWDNERECGNIYGWVSGLEVWQHEYTIGKGVRSLRT